MFKDIAFKMVQPSETWQLQNKNIEIKNVFEITLDDNIASERVLNRARGTDDNIKVFNDRLEDYKLQIKHIREYYQNILINVNGNDKVENISNKILHKILFASESNYIHNKT
jgi:adenylate kinase family enzyme